MRWAVSKSLRRISRPTWARVRPAAASPTACRSWGESRVWGAPRTLKVTSMVGKTARMRFHSSTRRMPSRITGVTGVSQWMSTS